MPFVSMHDLIALSLSACCMYVRMYLIGCQIDISTLLSMGMFLRRVVEGDVTGESRRTMSTMLVALFFPSFILSFRFLSLTSPRA